jgi:Tol biopolymer transport system component
VLSWVSRTGEQVGSVEPTGFNPSLSPDGRWVATLGPSGRGDADVWVTDLTRGVTSRITRGGGVVGAVIWSPDSRRVAFGRSPKIYVKTIDGSTDETALADVRGVPNSWSPDGKYLLYSSALGKLFLWPLTGGQSVPVGSRNGSSRDGRFSPDGQYIAYGSDEGGRYDVYIQPLPPATGRIQVSAAGGTLPRWSPRGHELFFLTNELTMMAVDVQAGQPPSVSVPRKLFALGGLGNFGYDISVDGQRFLMARRRVDVPDTPITVVLNWWADVAKRPN